MNLFSSRQRRARLKSTVASHSEALGLVPAAGDMTLVTRGRPRSIVMRCPDGCGEVITINLDPRAAKAWRLYQTGRGVSLFPSVWRDTGCGSHFILWNNVLFWMDNFDRDEYEDTSLDDRVFATLKPDVLTSFVDVADGLGEIPWAVLNACRRLQRSGRAAAGLGELKSSFRRI